MDNAGDWLYIVFLVIAGISGLFGSKNKNKRPKQASRQPEREIVIADEDVPQKGFWDTWQEMQNPQPQVQPTPKKLKQKKQKAATSPFLAGEKTTVKQMAAEAARTRIPIMEEESNLQDLEFDNAAELRKAVIYSEILNRKY